MLLMLHDGPDRAVKRLLVCLHDQAVELICAPRVAPDAEFLYRDSIGNSASRGSCVVVEEAADGRFAVAADGDAPVAGLARGDLPTFVMDAVVRGLVKDLTTAVALHAGAVACNGKAALIAGPTGAGKSSLVAWLIGNGFDYLSDEIALLFAADTTILGLPRALVLKPGSAEEVLALPTYQGAMPKANVGPPQFVEVEAISRLRLILPRYEAGRTRSTSPAQAAQTANN
jgi:hypothetical protein